MSTAVDFFKAQLPAHVTNAKSKAMQAMAGGLGGGFGNRISLRGSKFRFLQNGEDVGVADSTLDVVVFAMSSSVQRLYYKGAYDPNGKDKPTCFSHDGKVPSNESTEKQSPVCATCPQNIKGSGRQGNTKACAYKKRVVVLSPDDLAGPMYGLDVNAMSMFGEQVPTNNLYSFKGYYEKLVAHNMDIAAIVTRLSFDDAASVPKLHFTPLRALTADEFAQVQARMEDEDVAKVLADLTNESETTPAAPEPAAIAAPVAAPAPAARVQTPKAAPAPAVEAVATPAGVGGLVSDPPKKGFGAPRAQPAAVVAAAPAAAAPRTPKSVTVDLASMVNFDDD